MNERIKEIRKAVGLKQSEFAERIGIKAATVTSYETGLREPSDTVILSICREFNVSETWLRTGEGEMFVPLTRDQELAAFFGRTLSSESPEFVRRLVSVLAHLSVEEWELLEKMATKLADEIKKAPD